MHYKKRLAIFAGDKGKKRLADAASRCPQLTLIPHGFAEQFRNHSFSMIFRNLS